MEKIDIKQKAKLKKIMELIKLQMKKKSYCDLKIKFVGGVPITSNVDESIKL